MHPQDRSELGPFRTSSFSGGTNCVEVARASDGSAVVRDSKDHRQISLVFDRNEWTAFVLGVKNGEFGP